mgnify:CR=1 FL=1
MSALLALVLITASARTAETPVRASFADGQVLTGEVRTDTLVLTTGAGPVAIPLDDVGEVVPADGEGLADARGRVTVWLRNGSELRGTWTNPTLEMRVDAGGEQVRGLRLVAGPQYAHTWDEVSPYPPGLGPQLSGPGAAPSSC